MDARSRLTFALALSVGLTACTAAPSEVAPSLRASAPESSSAPSPSATPSPRAILSPAPSPTPPSTVDRLHLVETIHGDITPKSVVASPTGLVFAQNMMYRHTVTVYDRDLRLVATIPDLVRLARFGVEGYPGAVHGAPVEAAFTPDGAYAYISNYSMYGPGFPRPGHDSCSPAGGYDESFVYRIDVERLRIDEAIAVGSVPKFVAVTPDGRTLLVSNWCSYDLSVIDVQRGREIERIPLGPYPRGIAVDPPSRFAYVAVMGTRNVARVSLRTGHVGWISNVGGGPRHLVMDPTGRFLYVTLNANGTVAKVDLDTRRVVVAVRTGVNPRSMAISADGRSLYVVNYGSATVTKLRARDLHVLQVVRTNPSPIGITVDAATGRVWVACYGGSIMVFRDA